MGNPIEAQDAPPSEGSTSTGIERRMVFRVLSYWRGLLGDGAFPLLDRVAPDEIPDLWRHCFLLDLSDSKTAPVFLRVGEDFASDSSLDFVGKSVASLPDASLAKSAISYFQQVATKRVPISCGGEFTWHDGVKFLYRSIILPLSRDGETVSVVLGAANCRVVET